MFAFLVAFVASKYVELTEKKFEEYLGAPVPLFVKFYSPHCGHCQAMAEDFADAADKFGEDAIFGGVNCLSVGSVCEKQEVSGYPTIKLFTQQNKDGIEYDGDRTVDSFCDFVQQNTGVKAKHVPSFLTDLNPYNIGRFLDRNGRCAFIGFYDATNDRASFANMKIAAEAFDPEPNVSIGGVNCKRFNELCAEYNITETPTFIMRHNGEWHTFTEDAWWYHMADFINKKCDCHRWSGGLLDEVAGTIAEADKIAEKFTRSRNKEELVEKMKQIEGAEFYVKVMERIMQKGEVATKKDVAKMWEVITSKKGSWATLDGMKKRYNIFGRFVTTPSPTPGPGHENDEEEQAMYEQLAGGL